MKKYCRDHMEKLRSEYRDTVRQCQLRGCGRKEKGLQPLLINDYGAPDKVWIAMACAEHYAGAHRSRK